jgi:hypothetical protein
MRGISETDHSELEELRFVVAISNAVSSDLSFLRDFVPPNLALGSKRAIETVSAEAVECEEPEIE